MLAALFGSGMAVAVALGGSADPDPCDVLGAQYERAVANVADAVRLYDACVKTSRRADTCTAAFQNLDLAQEVFEGVVIDYVKSCRRAATNGGESE